MGSGILDKRLILVAGKGGVGRSTVAAAIAAATARRGRRTLLFQANAKDRVGALFGAAPVSTTITRLGDNLHAVNATPAAALEEYGLMVLRFRSVYKMVFENRVTRYFLRAIPGLDDYAIIGKAWYHTTEEVKGNPTWDTVVFDMPASGHAMSMLRLPRVILETVPEGPLTRDARALQALLTDPKRTGLVLVTLPEEMPANEARELDQALHNDVGIYTAQLVINQVYPDHVPAESTTAAILDALVSADTNATSPIAAIATHAHLARSRRRLNERYLHRLASDIRAPRCELPLLFVPLISRREIDHLSGILTSHLA